MLRQFSRRLSVEVVEAGFVISITQLKFCLSAPNIFLGGAVIVGSYGGLVHDGTLAAFACHGTLLAAITRLIVISFGFAQPLVMGGDYRFHAWSAAIANFNGIAVENFVVLAVGGEMFVDEG